MKQLVIAVCIAVQANVTTLFHVDPVAQTYTADEIAKIKARDDEWFTYCKPHNEARNIGFIHAVYSHKNCELGHFEPEKRNE